LLARRVKSARLTVPSRFASPSRVKAIRIDVLSTCCPAKVAGNVVKSADDSAYSDRGLVRVGEEARDAAAVPVFRRCRPTGSRSFTLASGLAAE
jgi:hypothetical protein